MEDQRHSKFDHVYAVVRVDLPFNEGVPANTLAVVKVVRSKVAAEAEAHRLNTVNADKNCQYICCASRLMD